MATLCLLFFVEGIGVGLLNVVLIVRFVAHLQAGTRYRPRKVLGGVFVRVSLAALLLFAAIQWGRSPALSAFAGLWLSRWLGVLWIVSR